MLSPDSVTIGSGEQYTVECNEGYKIKGDVSVMECNGEGSLTPPTLECEKSGGSVVGVVSKLLVTQIFIILQ